MKKLMKNVAVLALAAATVPSKVTAKGVTYTVTVIKAKAFAKKAKKAKKIVIPATIKRVNKKGFTGTKKLKTIIVKGTKSFTVKKGAFKKVNSKKITVKVNKKMKAKEFKKLSTFLYVFLEKNVESHRTINIVWWLSFVD